MIGVLALQGGFAEHEAMLRACNLPYREVRSLADTEGLTGLILPGGESTVLGLFLKQYGLDEWLRSVAARADFPIYGTCAGLIVLSTMGLLNVEVERNAYGRQLASFTATLEVKGLGNLKGHFIRAPKITHVEEGVEVLAMYEEEPVLVRQGNLWASSFHPELAGESGLHQEIFKRHGEAQQ